MLNLGNIPRHRIYAIISLLCPLTAFVLSWVVTNSHSEFWNEVEKDLTDDANRVAAAMIAAAEGIQIMFIMAAGFISGLFFSFSSLVTQRSKLGFLSVFVNTTPFLLLVISGLRA